MVSDGYFSANVFDLEALIFSTTSGDLFLPFRKSPVRFEEQLLQQSLFSCILRDFTI
jgi:hypothetical protein